MPCTPINLGRFTAIVCTRSPRPRCACGTLSAFQCDAPTQRRSGTCDKHLCARCATEVGPDKHHCPAHAEQRRVLISAASDVGPENQQAARDPVQDGLF